jgi:hypothetical protein
MRSACLFVLLAIAIASFLPLSPAQEPKDDASKASTSKSGKKEKIASKEKMLASGKVSGKLAHVEGAQRYFVVQVKYVVTTPNLGAVQNVANASRNLAQARQKNDRGAILNAQLDLARNQAVMYDYRTIDGQFEFMADDKMKIRTLQLPVDYDDKGKPKKLTTKELKERRGSDLSLPGFEADFDTLRQGQLVDVYLEKPQNPPANGKNKAAKADDAAGEKKEKERYKALMVVIRAEAQK